MDLGGRMRADTHYISATALITDPVMVVNHAYLSHNNKKNVPPYSRLTASDCRRLDR